MEQTEIASVQNERKKKITQWAKEEIGAWMPVILAVLIVILLSKTVCWNGSRRASAALNRRQINLSKQQQKTKVNLSGRIPCV